MDVAKVLLRSIRPWDFQGRVLPVLRGIFRAALLIAAPFLASLFLIILLGSRASAATPPGTVINNIASASYTESGLGPFTILSNTASVTVTSQRMPSTIELLQYAPGTPPGTQLVTVSLTAYSSSATSTGPFLPLGPPVMTTGAPISLAAPVPLVPAAQYHAGEAVFIRLTDLDQNLDPAVRETALITLRNPVTLDTEVFPSGGKAP